MTHGDFWIPEEEREIYRRALEALNAAGVPYVVAGAYAIYEHTGIYRQTKDLDLFCRAGAVVAAARALQDAGFVHAARGPALARQGDVGDHFVDLIYGMGNGVALHRRGVDRAQPAGHPGGARRCASRRPRSSIWHRLFISERHRHDMSDIVHLILCVGDTLDWERLVARVGAHWPLLLAQLLMFSYVYPGYRSNVPAWVMRAAARAGPRRRPAATTRTPT